MKDISIEYAHIYTNSKISEEQQLSLQELHKLQSKVKGKSLVFTIMVDDYSFPDPSFDYNQFTEWLVKEGLPPDVVFRESQLISLCDQVLHLLNDGKLEQQLKDYIKTKKYPCSLFIAAWYLLRLGHLKHSTFDEKFYAKSLINILPQSFKSFEDKAIEIIKSTKFAGEEKKIEYIFIEGRLIA